MSHSETRTSPANRLAYCPRCRGVLPFIPVRAACWGWSAAVPLLSVFGQAVQCSRCQQTYSPHDPASPWRRRALRYLMYSACCGLMASSAAASIAALGTSHPLSQGRVVLATWLLAGLTIGCLARSIRLWSGAPDYERLETYELQELQQRLCPGMIDSDVRRELGQRGWRPGKIRSVLSGLRPVPRGGLD